jgi:hypothetical protein
VSVVLLAASLLCLVVVSLIQGWSNRHERSRPEPGTTIMPFAGSGDGA